MRALANSRPAKIALVNGVGVGLTICCLALIANSQGPVALGLYVSLTSLSMILTTIAKWGWDIAVLADVPSIAEQSKAVRRYLFRVLGQVFVMAGGVSVITYFVIGFFAIEPYVSSSTLIWGAGVFSLVLALKQVISSVLVVLDKPLQAQVVTRAIEPVTILLCLFTLFEPNTMEATDLVLMALFSGSVSVIVGGWSVFAYYIRRQKSALDSASFEKEVLPNSDAMRPFWLTITSICSAVVANLDVILIAHFIGLVESGIYAILKRITGGLYFITGVFRSAYMPEVAKASSLKDFKKIEKINKRAIVSSMVIQAITLVCLVLLGPYLFVFLNIPTEEKYVNVLMVLIAGVAINSSTGFSSTVLNLLTRYRAQALAWLLCSTLYGVLVLIFAKYGSLLLVSSGYLLFQLAINAFFVVSLYSAANIVVFPFARLFRGL